MSATSLDLFTVDRAPVLPAGVQPDRGHHHRERGRILREELVRGALTAAEVFEVGRRRREPFREDTDEPVRLAPVFLEQRRQVLTRSLDVPAALEQPPLRR